MLYVENVHTIDYPSSGQVSWPPRQPAAKHRAMAVRFQKCLQEVWAVIRAQCCREVYHLQADLLPQAFNFRCRDLRLWYRCLPPLNSDQLLFMSLPNWRQLAISAKAHSFSPTDCSLDK